MKRHRTLHALRLMRHAAQSRFAKYRSPKRIPRSVSPSVTNNALTWCLYHQRDCYSRSAACGLVLTGSNVIAAATVNSRKAPDGEFTPDLGSRGKSRRKELEITTGHNTTDESPLFKRQ